ncbi:hypothetical protein FO519_003983 [Halicephalobus sp. NKZ332]|nr:hypothetical protein FO519_003983 [Halicephalobus sp. NKZ332]
MRTLIFFFVLFVGTCLAIYCDKDDLHCRQIRKLTTLLEDKEKELKRYKRIVDESTCNVCNIGGVNPCQNNGTCVVLPSDGTTQKFACDCPNNYAGDLCQTLVECKNNTCGVDATCTVFNHKTVCACPFGSTGDPNVACNFKTSQACFSGDPHYVTFDGLKYDYMGTCTYYVTKPYNWRTELNCPYECQPHSHYTMHASPCQPSCSRAANEVSNNCQDIPEEGCECDIGYYLDPNVDEDRDAQYVCRLIEDCGCTDEFGHYYKPNTTWMNADCTAIFTCKNGQLEEQVVSCSTNGKCVSENGQGTCVCNPGYLGSGHQCKLPPIRHCADLYVKQNIRKSGIYTVNIGATFDNETLYNPGTSISVYCDMEHDGGGWILVGGGRMNYTRSFAEYKAGFSEVLGDRKAFLGLEYLHQATNETDTSLRVIIDRCPEAPAPVLTECTYPSFTVYSEEEDYAVFIPEPCGGGNETGQYADPWVRWDPTKIGPGFATYDRDNHLNCSAANIGTGWWFDNSGTIGCGYANLNGQRLGCDAGSQVGYNGIFWDGKPIDDAVMYIRPRSFPNL